MNSIGPVGNVNFFQGSGVLKTPILQIMAKDQNGLDILSLVTKIQLDFDLLFSLGPLLHITLIVDMR